MYTSSTNSSPEIQTLRKVMTPYLLISGIKTSAYLQRPQATANSMVKTNQRVAYLQPPV